jgi:hypothetical protein
MEYRKCDMLVLFVGNGASPLAINRCELIGSLANVDVEFFDRELLTAGSPVDNAITPKIGSGLFGRFRRSLVGHFVASLYFSYRYLLRRPGVVVFHGVSVQFLAVAAVVLRAKIICVPQGSDVNVYRGSFDRWLIGLLLKNSAVVLCKSMFIERRVQSFGENISTTIFNWGVSVPGDSVRANVDMDALGATLRVVSARSNGSIYNIPVIFDAIGLIKKRGIPVYFIYISLNAPATAVDLSTADEVHIGIDGHTVMSLLSGADVLISIPTVDGFSTTVMESIMVGTLPVISDISAYEGEFSESEFLVERVSDLSAEGLADCLCRVYGRLRDYRCTRQVRASYGHSRFSSDLHRDRLQRIFDSLSSGLQMDSRAW